jgi:hypothetical protein
MENISKEKWQSKLLHYTFDLSTLKNIILKSVHSFG